MENKLIDLSNFDCCGEVRNQSSANTNNNNNNLIDLSKFDCGCSSSGSGSGSGSGGNDENTTITITNVVDKGAGLYDITVEWTNGSQNVSICDTNGNPVSSQMAIADGGSGNYTFNSISLFATLIIKAAVFSPAGIKVYSQTIHL